MSNQYDGPDRRRDSDFEREVLQFMARINEHMANQSKRCDSHADDIGGLDGRVTSLETSRTAYHTVLKAVGYGIGTPAVGSAAWFVWLLLKDLQGRH